MRYPLIITGASIGGTHLLATMLDMHPEFAVGQELNTLHHKFIYADWRVARPRMISGLRSSISPLQKLLRKVSPRTFRVARRGMTNSIFRGIRAYGSSPSDIVRRLNEADSLREFIDRFADDFLALRGKPNAIWAEKTLSNIYCYDDLKQIYPDLRVIVMARDGRDSCASVIKRGDEPLAAYGSWLARLSAGARVAETGDMVLVTRYEDLTADPEATLRRICEFIEIEYMDDLLHPERNDFWNTHSFHKSWGANPTSGTISTQSVGQYKKRLTREQLSLFWAVRLTRLGCAEFGACLRTMPEVMDYYGYDSDPGDEWIGLAGYDPTTIFTSQWIAERKVEISHDLAT